MEVLVHPRAEAYLKRFVAQPGGTILLHGPDQVGKRTAALEVARLLNCEQCSDKSCRSCKLLLSGGHPNVMLVEPDDKNKIGIEAVHELQRALQYERYTQDAQRVVVIANAESLTLPAANALLKTLEETPEGTSIILTSSSPNSLLPTILSRCTQVYMAPLSTDQVQRFLLKRDPGLAGRAETIAQMSHGAVGLALSYAEDFESLEQDQQIVGDVRELIGSSDLFARLAAASKVAAQTSLSQHYLKQLSFYVRTLARREGEHSASAANLAAVERLRQRLTANVNAKTAYEALAMELA